MNARLSRDVTQMAQTVSRIVSTKVIGRPGCIAIEILKDRHTGEVGLKIVQVSELVGLHIVS